MKKQTVVWVCAVLGIAAIISWQFNRPQPAGTSTPGASLEGSNPSPPSSPALSTNALTTTNRAQDSASATAPQRRAWDTGFIGGLLHQGVGSPVRFELAGGVFAAGIIQKVERRDGEVIFVSGTLTQPEAGRFFFQKQTLPGKQGEFAGVVEFPASQTAWRIEPTGPNSTSELVKRRLDEVICLLPPPDAAALARDAQEIPPLDPSDHPDYPIPAYQDGIIPLQSLPGATGVLYIDYRGGYTPTWGGIAYEKPNVSNAQIKDVWKRVAEDFQPFNINVTTDIKVYQAAPENSRQRVVVTPTTDAAPGAGGVAYLNSWNSTGDTPCWSFYSSGKSAAEVISHEAGHTLQLSHDGRTSPSEGYYGGQGGGSVGWAPIMGVGYYQPVAQWSKGEYANANNTEDDLARIVGNNNAVDYRTDDTGAALATARYLEVYSNATAFAEGVIETTVDTDAFQFTTSGGGISLRADPAPGDWADLAIMATLADASGTIIASNNPQTELWASIATNLPAGTYTFRVTGAGRNDPLTDGFSSYASLGYYSISGAVTNGRQSSRFTVAENSPNGTAVGTITATNLGVDPLVYIITSGNTGGAFAVNNSGALAVANSAALNYEALASNTQFAVQYQLFVNITNTANPSLTETNRRVVVQVLDVNEAPSAAGFTNTILAGTQLGTVISTVAGSDPDYYTILNYSILSGNTNNVFAVGAEDGVITVAGNLTSNLAGTYNLSVQATDGTSNAVANVLITVVTNNSPFQPGSLSYAVYDGIGSGTLVSDLTGNARFPNDPTWEQQRTSFEGDIDRADNFGSVMRGYLTPAASGNYTFFIATDDNGELWISTSTNPAAMTLAASVSGSGNWASPRQWTKFASQTSTARSLTAGQAYYIEARHKEGAGGDNLAVAWKGPATSNLTNVISGLYLAPYLINYLPHASGFTANVRRDAFPGARLGRVTVTDQNVNDTHTFVITAGNGENIFGVDASGYVVVTNTAALTTTFTPSFSLTIQATDSGSPALSATATATLNLVEPDVIAPAQLQREMFYSIGGGTAVSDLTSNAKYPGKPDALVALSSFSAATDVSDNFGSRVRGYLVPSISGDYLFFIASDDASQLKLSSDSNAANAAVIATVSGWTAQNEWTKYAGQTSALITNLQAGEHYYIEALHKEGGGGDNLSVAWLVPGSGVTNIIPDANLEPLDINSAPQMGAQSFGMFQTVPNGTVIGIVTASDSPLDSVTFQLLAGNTNSTFMLDPASGVLRVANNSLIASAAVTNFPLTVAAQDSGYGGQYPLRAATNTVTVSVSGTNVPFVWSGGGATNLWSDSGNWAGGTLYPGVRLVFGQTARQTNVNNAVSNVAWAQFNTNGFSVSGNPVTLQAGLTNTGANTWGIPTTLGAVQTWVHNGGGELNVSGAITNSGFTHTLVANGDLRLSAPVTGSGGLTKSGTARLLMQGTNTHTGPTTISAASGTTTALEIAGTGDFGLVGSDLTMNGRMDLWSHNATLGALNGNGLIFANNGNRTLTVGANNGSGTFSGIIQNSSWASGVTLALVKNGTGNQTFAGTNIYSGDLTINAGAVTASLLIPAASTGGSLGSNAPARVITVAPGATLNFTLNNIFGGSGVSASSRPALVVNGTLATTRFNVLPNVTLNGGLLRNANATDPVTYDGFQFVGSVIVGGTNASTFDTTTGRGNHLRGAATTVFTVADATGDANADLVVNTILRDGSNDYPGTGALQKSGAGTMVLATNNVYSGGTTISNGTLQIGSGGAAGSVAGNITNHASLVFNRSGTLTHSGSILGAGSVTKTGSSSVTFSAANTYTGATAVNQGTLTLAASGSIANSSSITVAAGAIIDVTAKGGWVVGAAQTLQGSGIVAGATSISGTVRPGASPGTLSFTGNTTLAGTAVMEISKAGATLTNDLLSTTGTLTYGGTLTVTNLGPDALLAGNTFKLFNAAGYNSNFTATNLPPLTTGLAWSWTPSNGTLAVVPSVNTTPTNFTAAVNANQLTLAWPSDHIGWTLQTQTNALGVGLSTSGWYPVADSSATNSVTVAIDPTQPTVFYRMVYP